MAGLIATTKARLMLQKAELERRPKSKNPFKFISTYRSARMFLAANKSLYIATKSRSEEMARTIGRSLLSVPGEDVQPVNDDPSPGASLEGIAVRLDRPLNDTTKQQLLDAANTIASCCGQFEDDQANSDASTILSDEYVLASESLTSLVSSDTEETPDVATPLSSSPTVVNHCFNFPGSIGTTINFGGTGGSGSVNHNATTTLPGPTDTT